jgi:hypothetical protein
MPKFKHNIIVTDQIQKLTLEERSSATLLISIEGETAIVLKNRYGANGQKVKVAELPAFISEFLAAVV